ncbi:hypothetical protein ACFMPD_04810 [Sedimentitalea sp. HM32M-2]|uniref:hypothetical protein n=1 Tax=Sedimentitalea sp. HM32M-2 TaxID=3351566 RepID=UPI00362AB466
MTPKFLTALAILLPVTAVAASGIDANGDGMLTLDEVQAVLPDTTAESFSAMDANADGALDQDEVTAAEDAGLLPKT